MRRLARGGHIDRARPVSFSWNHRHCSGFVGDTLASALLAEGIDVVGTSVALGRPLCDDTGWKAVEERGRRRVERCDCWRSNLAVRALADARIPRRYVHCDLLVVGAGPAGLAAALIGARAGARVMLVDADTEVGGGLLRDEPAINGVAARDCAPDATRLFDRQPSVRPRVYPQLP